MTSRIEENATARHVDGLAGTRIEHTAAPDQLPLHIQLNLVAPILPAVTGDRVAFGGVLFATDHEIRSPPSLSAKLSPLCGCHSKNNSHEGTYGVLAVLPYPLITLGVGEVLNWRAWYPLRCGRIITVPSRPKELSHRAMFAFLLLDSARHLRLSAQDLKEFEKKITEFTLPNGLHFILLERHEAPVVSFHTLVNAGSATTRPGRRAPRACWNVSGTKARRRIGTANWALEKKALDAIEEAWDRVDAELDKGIKADPSRVEMLRSQARVAIDLAQRAGRANEYAPDS